jgi:GNAT superfamily N-acetyltransferase
MPRTHACRLRAYLQCVTTALTDGTRVAIREIRPSDKRLLVEGLGRLSEETRRRRFLTAKPRFTSSELRYLTELDGRDHYALIAVLADRPEIAIAVARFVRDPEHPGTAEAAIVVADPHQRKGLGKRLALLLADAARERGFQRFSATMLSDNPAALSLMRTLAARLEDGGHSAGVRELVAEIPAAA